jgi:hypothetical protein
MQTCDWLQRAMTLIPSPLRQPHRQKLAQLREWADRLKVESAARDPFNRLPFEIIIQIMQEGGSDSNFILRMSWTNTSWRKRLIHHCPELWGTLRVPWSELKPGIKFPEKHQA